MLTFQSISRTVVDLAHLESVVQLRIKVIPHSNVNYNSKMCQVTDNRFLFIKLTLQQDC